MSDIYSHNDTINWSYNTKITNQHGHSLNTGKIQIKLPTFYVGNLVIIGEGGRFDNKAILPEVISRLSEQQEEQIPCSNHHYITDTVHKHRIYDASTVLVCFA